jgi:hypothetical protein
MDGNNNPEKLTLSAVLDSPSPTKKRKFTLVLEVSLTEAVDEKSAPVVTVTASQSPARKMPAAAITSTPIVEEPLPLITVGRSESCSSGIAPQSSVSEPSEPRASTSEEPVPEAAPLPVDDDVALPVDDQMPAVDDQPQMAAPKPKSEAPLPNVFQNCGKDKVSDCSSEAEFRKGLFRKARARVSSETDAVTTESDWESDESDSTRDDDPADWTVLTEELERSLSDTPNDTFDLMHTFGYSREM